MRRLTALNGATVNVDDELAERLIAEGYKPLGEKATAKKAPAKKAASTKSTTGTADSTESGAED